MNACASTALFSLELCPVLAGGLCVTMSSSRCLSPGSCLTRRQCLSTAATSMLWRPSWASTCCFLCVVPARAAMLVLGGAGCGVLTPPSSQLYWYYQVRRARYLTWETRLGERVLRDRRLPKFMLRNSQWRSCCVVMVLAVQVSVRVRWRWCGGGEGCLNNALAMLALVMVPAGAGVCGQHHVRHVRATR